MKLCLRPDGSDQCGVGRSFNSTVILLIDGLRFDFAEWDSSVDPLNTPHYLNKMPVFRDLMEGPHPAFLSRFVADAPTTTAQRLKALVTGGLPTFIDLASNFDSARLEEDNIVSQLHNAGRNVTVLGDDTWLKMFPEGLTTHALFPSFDVRDLDSVDAGIMRHLHASLAAMGTPEWEAGGLLVAHFLGVDHAGHRFGPSHPKMARKLEQMNDIVRSVAVSLPPSTLLLVLGDHGMTTSGDHGGDSSLETNAALFAHWKDEDESVTSEQRPVYPAVVQQVSLVPTLALLLGVPLPFSSVGAVVPQLLPPPRRLPALRANVRQVSVALQFFRK